MAAATDIFTPGYLIEAVVIIGGVALLTFAAKRQLRKGRDKRAW